MGSTNGHAMGSDGGLRRAEELDDLFTAVRGLILPFVKSADDAATQKATGNAAQSSLKGRQSSLVDTYKPAELAEKMRFDLPSEGAGKDGLLEGIEKVLRYSVNTWDQGFMDKLYASNNPVGVISDMVLSVLNTNLHVFQVSPALTVVEKTTAKALANLFGFTGPMAGGMTCQGGSSSNLTSMVVARNTLYPGSKVSGIEGRQFVVFTSAHGHYSVMKSAMICGLGESSVVAVPVDDDGCMIPAALKEAVINAKNEGKIPFYVNTTAGTTVRGSFEPFEDISKICKEHNLWMHIDGSWGGPVIISNKHKWKMSGSHLADSITINPHKMMNVPATCSFLLGPDMRIFQKANSTTAGYLFHGDEDGEIWDMADLTLQCGRRGDSLKLALAWLYYGSAGFEKQIDHAFDMASLLYELVQKTGNFEIIGGNPTPCLQVCFFSAPGGKMASDPQSNTYRTKTIVEKLISRGFMVDYAPGNKGSFLRVVVNVQTLPETVRGLVKALEAASQEVV